MQGVGCGDWMQDMSLFSLDRQSVVSVYSGLNTRLINIAIGEIQGTYEKLWGSAALGCAAIFKTAKLLKMRNKSKSHFDWFLLW